MDGIVGDHNKIEYSSLSQLVLFRLWSSQSDDNTFQMHKISG